MGETSGHRPVLPVELHDLLSIPSGGTVVDATVGLGGHSAMLAEAIGPTGTLIGLDVDPANLAEARHRLSDCPCRVELIQANFAKLGEALAPLNIDKVDIILADLGVSSTQLDQADRGFSFRHDGPLDMRMDPNLTTSATELVNGLKEKELGDLFYYNSQETASRKIARRICAVRRDGRITTTAKLADIVCKALGVNPESRQQKIHPATRTFLALRMAVNDEIGCLSALLDTAPNALAIGGKVAVIAFHSVEDKVVKLDFRKRNNEGIYRIVTKKPVIASGAERDSNPRSRSAKLRVAERIPEEVNPL